MAAEPLTFGRIDVDRDGPGCYARYREAAVASLGWDGSGYRRLPYLAWLRQRCEEYPDGHVLASVGKEVVGQLEAQVPYGRDVGYVNLFHIAARWRRLGIGRRVHAYAERYCRAWGATAIELDVGPGNAAAVGFYRTLGYRLTTAGGGPLWRMRLGLATAADQPASAG